MAKLLLKKPAPAGVKAPAKAAPGVGFGGAAKHKVKAGGAFAIAEGEQKRYEMERAKPWNLKVPVGGSLEVYFLDKGEPWYRYEHKIGGGPTSSGKDYPCIKDGNEPCPLCAKEGKDGTYVMYLTCVVPLEKYEKSDGTEVTRRFAKKLFPIKTKMSPKYRRLFETHGHFRGMVVKVHRDNKMDATTGSDVDFLRFLTEGEIQAFAKADRVKGEAGDQIRKAKIAEPFDYDKVMPRPTAKELAAMVGAKQRGIGHEDVEDDSSDFGGSAGDWGLEE